MKFGLIKRKQLGVTSDRYTCTKYKVIPNLIFLLAKILLELFFVGMLIF